MSPSYSSMLTRLVPSYFRVSSIQRLYPVQYSHLIGITGRTFPDEEVGSQVSAQTISVLPGQSKLMDEWNQSPKP